MASQPPRASSALLLLAVIVAERRLPVEFVFKANQIPPNLVLVPAIFRVCEKSHDRILADQNEEWSLLDFCQDLNLLTRIQFGRLIDIGEQLARLCAQIFEPLRVS